MARHQLTLQEQLRGIRAAIRSKRTPPQLRDGLRKREQWLQEKIGTEHGAKSTQQQSRKTFSTRVGFAQPR